MKSMRICPSCGGNSFTNTPPAARPAYTPPPAPYLQPAATAAGPGYAAAGYSSPGYGPASASFRPQGAVLYAGFWRRVLASLIDGFVIAFIDGIAAVVFVIAEDRANVANGIPVGDATDSPAAAVFTIGASIAILLYFVLMESSKYQATLGKMAIDLKVTDIAGGRISFGRALGRYLLKSLEGLTLGIGLIMAGATARKQALHDKMAGTLVIRS
jgi:uncharacterized RDD family membrane protein YckC